MISNKKIESEGEKRLREVADKIYTMPTGPAKWKKIQELWLALNPADPTDQVKARDVHRATLKENKLVRATRANRFASSNTNQTGVVGGSGFRMGMRMPAALMQMIELFEPTLFIGPDAKPNLHKMMRTFPEYNIPEVI